MARASYVDPRLLDRYEEGVTIRSALVRANAVGEPDADRAFDPSFRDAVEAAVLELLEDGRAERAAA